LLEHIFANVSGLDDPAGCSTLNVIGGKRRLDELTFDRVEVDTTPGADKDVRYMPAS
jgi:hypothetical protein